ncbi:conserved hypothetical protein, partial [Listeria monocytogenes FSL F2-208]
ITYSFLKVSIKFSLCVYVISISFTCPESLTITSIPINWFCSHLLCNSFNICSPHI